MPFDASAFLASWDAAAALLEQDGIVRRWLAESQSSLGSVRRSVERDCAGRATVDEVFAALHEIDDPIPAYCTLLVLRTLGEPWAPPPPTLKGDLELSYGEMQIYAGDVTVTG